MSLESVVVEACVTSAKEAVACFTAGAGRVELCQALDVGGLTPQTDDVAATLSAVPGPVFVLVRPRADTFCLEPAEVGNLIEEVASLVALGVDGVVVGVLDRTGRIDHAALAELVSATKGQPVTFHRAFDHVKDPLGGVEILVQAGVSRVLTSGGAATAWQGRATLRELVQTCGDELIVLGGGRIRGDHVGRLVKEAGLTEVHARAAAIVGVIAGLSKS
ncbi:MAG TPA: copper homeostasis protein CutC [Rhodothermales bacterium]|nr:copper homeostasis protein CutC [Rhodothermales bacterium]